MQPSQYKTVAVKWHTTVFVTVPVDKVPLHHMQILSITV
jgi:hypothetical protein